MTSATDIFFNLEAVGIFISILISTADQFSNHIAYISINIIKIVLSGITLVLARIVIRRIKKLQMEKIEESLKIVNDKSEKLKIVTMGFENGNLLVADRLKNAIKENVDQSGSSSSSNTEADESDDSEEDN